MNSKRHQSSHHLLFRFAVAAGALGLTLLVWPSETFAHGGHGKYQKKHGKGSGVVVEPYGHHHGHHYVPKRHHRRFEVPRFIRKHHRRTYKPYHHGRVYHAPHRHYHVIYKFPVYYGSPGYGYGHGYGEPVYYPYAYCGTELFARGVFTPHGPSFSFGFSIVR